MTDVIVVGAGAAGLTAARDLTHGELGVTVLEARDRVGGRMFSIRKPDLPVAVELGAEFVHGVPADIMRFVEEARLTTREMPDQRWYAPAEGQLKPAENFDEMQVIMNDLDEYRGPDLSFREFLAAHNASEEAKVWATEYIEGFNAADASRVSVHFLQQGNRAAEQIEGDRLLCLNEGYSALAEHLSKSLADVRLSCPVTRVTWEAGHVRVQTPEGAFEARRLLVTVPLGVWQAGAITFNPDLSGKAAAAGRLASGPVIRISLRFRSPFWAVARPELRGASMLHTRDRDFPTWWSTEPVSTSLLTGWAAAPRAERLSRCSQDELISTALDSLARILALDGRTVREELVGAWTHNWQTDPFSRGAYSYVPVGAIDAPRALAEPVENTLFFAGEATDTTGFTGTVHGAIASGHRAAAEILSGLPQPRSR